ncbi:MAG: class I SAM-dependent methyltransferase [Leptospiraceae bacterium]|nr:class I SAM-dependent methyltransferase [Leptospiraceae bacterium]
MQWCQKAIAGVTWNNNEYIPPTQYSNNSFDLIYAISVFTHLDEKYQTAWLNELYRIASVGATLILTVHGEPIIETAVLTPEQQATLQQVGFLYVSGTTGKFKLDGLPDFYQTSYHTQNYIERIWGSLFEIVAQVPRGIGSHQNAIILRKK